MKIVAITGSIGCGKTTLANIVRKLGFAVYDIDAWVRKIYYKKSFLDKLSSFFPESVVNGSVNKKILRNQVFTDKHKLQMLEQLIYPFLNKSMRHLIIKNARRPYIVFVDAALLFEKGWNKYCDVVILADVDYEIQKKRVMKRDHISVEDFEKINNIQLKNEYKKMLSDIVVNTDKPLNRLKVEMIKIIERLM